jgi:hypothetical protein
MRPTQKSRNLMFLNSIRASQVLMIFSRTPIVRGPKVLGKHAAGDM